MEEYSPWPDSSRAPETIQPLPNRIDLKAKIFTELDMRNPLSSTSPCTFVDPRNRNMQRACNLRNRHQLTIPFIRRHASPRAANLKRAADTLFSGTARTRISPLLPVIKSTLSMPHSFLTAECPASLQKFHVSERHLLSFVASLSVPPVPEPPQPAYSISPCTQKEPLD